MARQRFIWPTIWDDPDLGRLDAETRLLYIGCFSLADDDGRILGDHVYLKTQVFRYQPTVTPEEVERMRDQLAEVCKSFHVYQVRDTTYIAFLNWREFQKPKYPTPSKLPPPPRTRKRRNPVQGSRKSSGNDSGNDSGKSSGNDSPNLPGTIPPRVGLGKEELTKAVTSKADAPRARAHNPAPEAHETNGPRPDEQDPYEQERLASLIANTTDSLRSL